MDLVLVLLSDVRKYIIVPESYVYGLNISALKNLGRNSCRDYLVYWSDDCVEGVDYPDPIPNAPKRDTFPAGKGAWLRGRTIYFTGSYII